MPSLSTILAPVLTRYCNTEYGATFTGSGEFTHPTWGQSLLATCLPDGGHNPTVLIMDHDGVPQWAKTTSYSPYPLDNYAPLQPVTDRWGNLFIGYDGHVFTGFGEGVEVLRPTADGAESVSMNHVEWSEVYGGINANDLSSVKAFTEHPLFFPAFAIYDGDTDVYRIQVVLGTYHHYDMGVKLVEYELLEYEWRGSQYELILKANEWLLPADALGSVISPDQPALWARVALTDGHARVIVCPTQRFPPHATPTCTAASLYTMTHRVLEGDLDGDTALLVGSDDSKWNGSQFEDTPGISRRWGILHVDADGVPVSIERPEGSECLLSNGEPFTYPPGRGYCEEP
jgi:hypothetical protein